MAVTGGGRATLGEKVARSATRLIGRRFLILGLSAVSTAALTRGLGPEGYGVLATSLALWALLTSFGDAGFGLFLGRELPVHPDSGRLLGATAAVQLTWGLVLTGVQVAIAYAQGIDTPASRCLIALAVATPFVGLNGARSVFTTLYKTGQLVVIDLTVLSCQILAVVLALHLDRGVVTVALVTAVGSACNAVVVWRVALVHVRVSWFPASLLRSVFSRVVELGVVSSMSRVYVSADLVLLGWLAVGPGAVGAYAVASKIYIILGTFPVLITNAAMPALSTLRSSPEPFSALLSRVAHWNAFAGFPLYLGAAIAAPWAILLLGGQEYGASVPMLRLLCLVGLVSIFNGLLVTVMVVLGSTKEMFWQSAAGIVVNVGGNVLLVPSHGALACVWVTAATEVTILACALLSLRRRTSLSRLGRGCVRPMACAALGATSGGSLLGVSTALALGVALLVFLVSSRLLRTWPTQLAAPKTAEA